MFNGQEGLLLQQDRQSGLGIAASYPSPGQARPAITQGGSWADPGSYVSMWELHGDELLYGNE